jgi:hypothetical protein
MVNPKSNNIVLIKYPSDKIKADAPILQLELGFLLIRI